MPTSKKKTSQTKKESVKKDEGAPKKEKVSTASTEKEQTKAKAGKRSVKGATEAAEKKAKIERQKLEDAASEEKKPKAPVKPPRSKLERRGKKYRQSAGLIEKGKLYNLNEAAKLAIKTSVVNFDASVELHVRLNVDPKQADQNIRGSVVLPAGTGKDVRIAVLAEPDDVKKVKAAGADEAGSDSILADIEKNKLNFDVLIATPEFMSRLGKYAKTLGPKGLMPNPKSGTVTKDVAAAVKEAKSGKVEYRVDSAGIIHVVIGKASFGPEKILENAKVILTSVKHSKPATVKGAYINSVYISTAMGPSVKIDSSEI